jgi:hypothetical protein
MNFTTYESGFGGAMNGPSGPTQPSVNSLGKSSRIVHNEFGAASANTATGTSNTRNGQGGLITNSTNSLMKSH